MIRAAIWRALKVGAFGWVGGVFGTMLVGAFAVGGIASVVAASLPASVGLYLDAHGFFLYPSQVGGFPPAAAADAFGVLPVALWMLLPVCVLLACGGVLARDAATRREAAGRGATVAAGYGFAAVLTLLWLSTQAARGDGSGLDVFEGALLVRLAVAGLITPAVLGALGGLFRYASLR